MPCMTADHGGSLQRGPDGADAVQYRYAEEQMMRIMAGWIALTPELVVKLEFGGRCGTVPQHADILGKRLPELRARAQCRAAQCHIRDLHADAGETVSSLKRRSNVWSGSFES